MATMENLRDAFVGEAQAYCRYVAYARRAQDEGYPEAARLFRAAAQGELIHALAHLHAMDGVGSTQENLSNAIHGEGLEFQDLYPRYAATAMEENHPAAVMSFQNAMAVEQVHHSLYMEALRHVEQGRDLPLRRIFVCRRCGDAAVGKPPQTCPVCSAAKEDFGEAP